MELNTELRGDGEVRGGSEGVVKCWDECVFVFKGHCRRGCIVGPEAGLATPQRLEASDSRIRRRTFGITTNILEDIEEYVVYALIVLRAIVNPLHRCKSVGNPKVQRSDRSFSDR